MFPTFDVAADLLPDWADKLRRGVKPILFPVGDGGFEAVRIGPGILTVIGGAPGVGKTALVMQWTIDALRATPDLRALVVNVETGPELLLDRQLSRLSGIDYGLIRDREPLDPERFTYGLNVLESLADRLAFLKAPYTLEHAAAAADSFKARLIVIDYLQRIPARGGEAGDARTAVNAAMDAARRFTDEGATVIALSSLTRGKGKAGSTYAEAGLASFRESGEVEFGADNAYILAPGPTDDGLILRHLKARHSEPRDLLLSFDGAHQSFTAVEAGDLADAAGYRTADGDAETLSGAELAEIWRGGDA